MIEAFIRDVKKNAISHGSIPFWSWNDKLEEKELRRQINNMHDLEMKGFFMHARFGLETEYMSEEWFDAIKVCIDEAKKLGMEAWCYDENGWPSGFAGGKLLDDPYNFARFLTYSVEEKFPEDAFCVYVIADGIAEKADAPVEGVKEYHVVRKGEDFSYVDILNPKVVQKFIEATYEEYKKRLDPEVFGSVMPGFFTDEPQYFRYGTPWSNTLPEIFREKYGYEITDHLVKLFVDCEGYREFRYDYHALLGELYIDGYIKQIYEWCDANGCQVTGHSIEEASLSGQIMGCGSVMPFYQYQHIPGIDWLSRPLKKDAMPKQLGSVCAQVGKDKAITESYANCGWDVSPKELKNIMDFQYVNGVNMLCQHLYAYSYRGQRKRDYPAHYSEHLPWQKHLADFNRYYNHLGYMLSLGTEAADTLVIHPIHDAYQYYVCLDSRHSHNINHLNEKAWRLSDRLSENQIAYHYADETMLKDLGKVEGARIRLGKCVYDQVVIPDVDSLDASTVEILKEFKEKGGKIYLQGAVPTRMSARIADLSFLEGSPDMDELIGMQELSLEGESGKIADLRTQMRIIDSKRLIFVTNVRTKDWKKVRIRLKNCANLVRLDIATLETVPVYGARKSDGSFEMITDIGDSEAFVLLECDSPAALPMEDYKEKCDAGFRPEAKAKLISRSANALTLDTVGYSLNGAPLVENVPLMQLKDELLRSKFEGELTLVYRFKVDKIPGDLRLAYEPMDYLSLTVNGKELKSDGGWWLDRQFLTAQLTGLVHPGENEIRCSIRYYQRDYVYYVLYGGASESLRNCLNFDTEIECMYLFGDFDVKTEGQFQKERLDGYAYFGDFAVTQSKDTVDLRNLITDGYPFFAGSITAEFEKEFHSGDSTLLLLEGRYAVCEVEVNGEYAGKLMFRRSLDLKDHLKKGKNVIRLTLTNANRNLLGPLHHDEVDVWSSGPSIFTGEKAWTEGEWKHYLKDRTCFVRFGVDCEDEA